MAGGPPLGRPTRSNYQLATDPTAASGGFGKNLTAIAAVAGVIAVVAVGAALVLSGGGGDKKDDPNARRATGNAAGDFQTQVPVNEIGRASCRERVQISVVVVAV